MVTTTKLPLQRRTEIVSYIFLSAPAHIHTAQPPPTPTLTDAGEVYLHYS